MTSFRCLYQVKNWLLATSLLIISSLATSSVWAQSDTTKPAPPAENSAFSGSRINSIHERINLLKKLIADEKEATQKMERLKQAAENKGSDSKPSQPPPSTNEPKPATGSGSNHRQEDITPEKPDTTMKAKPEMAAKKQNLPSGQPVVMEPIDSFELANSLFLTGNATAARKSYQVRLRQEVTSAEEVWLKCLVGCCYRLENDFANAEKIFRELANEKIDYYPVNYARWSLKYLEQRKSGMKRFEAHEAQLNAILKELNNNEPK